MSGFRDTEMNQLTRRPWNESLTQHPAQGVCGHARALPHIAGSSQVNKMLTMIKGLRGGSRHYLPETVLPIYNNVLWNLVVEIGWEGIMGGGERKYFFFLSKYQFLIP